MIQLRLRGERGLDRGLGDADQIQTGVVQARKAMKRVTAAFAVMLWIAEAAAIEAGTGLLTPDERAWLAAHPELVVGFPRNQPPAVMLDADGQARGVFIDFLELLNDRLGTTIRVELDTWPRLVARAEQRQLDMLGLTFPLDAHRAHFDFTTPFFETYYYLYARNDDPDPPRNLEALSGERVGYIAATRMVEHALAGRGDITLVPLPSQEALAAALLAGQVDVVVASVSLEYWRKQHTQTGFLVSGMIPELGGELVMSVRKDWPELTAILNAGLATITTDERQAIIGRWLGADLPEPPSDWPALNSDERAWLAKKPVIRVGIDTAWAPVAFTDQRSAPQGISVAYPQRLERQLGLRFELIPTPSWSAAKQRFADGQLDLLPAVAETPQRRRTLLLTEPYATFPAAIFSAAEVAYLGGTGALRERLVTVIRGDTVEDWLREQEPRIRLQPVADTREALRRVARGEAYAFVGNLVTTSYYIGQSGLTQIKVAGETPFVYRLTMAVARDQPMLASVLQKGLNAIPQSERDGIYHNWISIRYAHETDWRTLWRILGVTAALLAIIAMWNLSLTREIARRRRAEAELREAKEAAEQANRAKGAFLANISHELRTPLNVLLGFASLMQGSARSGRERGWLDAIHSAGKSLAQLIDDLLDLSRIEAGRLRTRTVATDLRALFHELETMFSRRAAENGLRLQTRVEDDVPAILLLDDTRVRQVLVNLIGNAIKFTEAGGVDVRASATPSSPSRVQLSLSVADTGPGIGEEDRETIFEAFTQGNGPKPPDGAGLGLAISRRLAVMMGGDIRLASAPGRGSTFALELSEVARGSPIHADTGFGSPGAEPAGRLAPARLLIADDRADNRALLRELLRGQPLDILEAGDGNEAVALAQVHHPDLILLDLAMPGLDGLEAARRLRPDPVTAQTPILGITAADTRDNDAALSQVFERILRKPLAREDLLAALARWLRTDEAPQAPPTGDSTTVLVGPTQPLRISPALLATLRDLQPPFASINAIQRLAEALRHDALTRGDTQVRQAADRLLDAAERFDLIELTEHIAALKQGTMAIQTRDSRSRRAATT